MSEAKFTWIPFYKELAQKVLDYKDKRKDLMKIFIRYLKNIQTFYNGDQKMVLGLQIQNLIHFLSLEFSIVVGLLKIEKKYFLFLRKSFL